MIGEIHYNAQDAQMWLLDSGGTFHMTPDIEWFSNYLAVTNDTVRLDNGQAYTIAGMREVPIKLPNGNTIILHQVWHIPALKRSLVSIDMITEDGYRTTLSES